MKRTTVALFIMFLSLGLIYKYQPPLVEDDTSNNADFEETVFEQLDSFLTVQAKASVVANTQATTVKASAETDAEEDAENSAETDAEENAETSAETDAEENAENDEVEETNATYSQKDLEILAHAINAEQGIEYEDEQITNKLQIYAGQVILNRVAQHYMGATTIEEVLYTPGQYACVSDCSWDNPISSRAYYNASLLLSGAPYWEIYGIPQMPDNVIYQAEFTQGKGTWLKLIDTYFCYE